MPYRCPVSVVEAIQEGTKLKDHLALRDGLGFGSFNRIQDTWVQSVRSELGNGQYIL